MHIVTFYSFKGGVGRTMAMVNIANAMALAGKTVLMVDFDLEAPGIETFKDLKGPGAHPGLVEFVAEYIRTNEAPDVKQYIYAVKSTPANKGRLFVMPAGLRDSSYGSRLNSINWQALYREQEGYVLFEDLKKQWQSEFSPDYVLIDSRTGHTDVGGICTRQLPNHVAMLFFPNEQNLKGIAKVALDIHKENQTRVADGISTTFVCSNVPDIDDEDRILAKQLNSFKTVGCSPKVVIHHYPSMHLLDQEIFTRTRPNSRLAREYEFLRKQIIQSNPEDREGVYDYLKSKVKLDDEVPLTRLREIIQRFHADSDILYYSSRAMERIGKFEEKEELLISAAEISKNNRTGLVARSIILRDIALYRKAARIKQDPHVLWQLIAEIDSDVSDIRLAVEMLNLGSISDGNKLIGLPSYKRLSFEDKNSLLSSFFRSDRFGIVKAMLDDTIKVFKKKAEIAKDLDENFALPAIASGRTKFAVDYLTARGANDPKSREIIDAFNYAAARWKHTGNVITSDFERVLKLNSEIGDTDSANYFQCMALSHWALGNLKRAREYLKMSYEQLSRRDEKEKIFSAWTYLWVLPSRFKVDLDEMKKQVASKELRPAFIRLNDTMRRIK